jgi:UDPglucose--hexose-1-phosphate uridylyltransferase
MAGGLFELRRDDITGWWVAVVVDREFDRARFARPAARVSREGGRCQNCDVAVGDGAFHRVLKPSAFTVAGGDGREPGQAGRDGGHLGRGAGHAREARDAGHQRDTTDEPGLGLVGDVGSWGTIAAPRGHHGSLAEESTGIVVDMLALAREQIRSARRQGGTEYLQVVQNWGAQAGARTDHLCIDTYDLPQIPHRIGEELGGAARYVIREGGCPWCRLVRDEVARRERLVFEDAAGVCFAPWASRSPFELWVVPRHHDADFARAADEQLTSAAETLRKVVRLLDVLEGPPYNLVLHTAPLHERVDDTYHWHWEIHPRLREIAGLELGTGLPVNPVSPEDAVEELLSGAREGRGAAGPATLDAGGGRAPRSWDAFPRSGGSRP